MMVFKQGRYKDPCTDSELCLSQDVGSCQVTRLLQFQCRECPIASIKSRQIPKNRGHDTSESSVGFLHPKSFLGTFLGVSSASIPASLTFAAECLSFALLLHSIYSSSLPAPERNQFNKNVSKIKLRTH